MKASTATLWRLVFAVLMSVAAATAIYQLIHPPSDPGSSIGIATAVHGFGGHITTATAYGFGAPAYRVDSVIPGSVAARAHIKPGDVLVPASLSAWFSNEVPRALPVTVHRGAQSFALRFWLTIPPQVDWSNVVWCLVRLMILVLLAWIVIVRVDDVNARILALAMIGPASYVAYAVMPPPFSAIELGDQFVGDLISIPTWILFGAIFPTGRAHGIRRTIAAFGIPIGVLAVLLLDINTDLFNFWGASIPAIALTVGVVAWELVFPLVWIELLVGWAQTRGEARERIAWAALMIVVATSGSVVGVLWALAATYIVLPFGLGYALIRHRVLDMAFVANRAAVFAALSALLLPLFALTEWLAETYVRNQSHTLGTIVELGLALVLFASFRALHGRAETWVGDRLFRDRRNRIMALRERAEELGFLDRPEAITTLVRESVMRYADAPDAGVYQMTDARVPSEDRAVLALKARHYEVEAPPESAFAGALLLPFYFGGELGGFLSVSTREREAYDPDERQALRDLASATGVALERTRLREAERRAATLETEVALLRRECETLRTITRDRV